MKLEPGEETEITFLKEIEPPTESDRACIAFMFRKISDEGTYV